MQHQIVQDVEIADALLQSYTSSLGQADVASAMLRLHDNALGAEAAIGAAGQVFPEIWRRLDSARAAAASTGRDLSHYDSIRERVGRGSEFGITSVTTVRHPLGPSGGTKIAEGNEPAARAARDAIAVFRSTFADHPWHAQNEPVPELRSGKKLAMLISIVGGLILVAGILALMLFNGD